MGFVDKTLEFRKELRRLFLGWLHPQTLASEKAREELNVALKKHWAGDPLEVHELIRENWYEIKDPSEKIHSKEDRFIVFIDQEFDVDWITKSDVSVPVSAAECISTAESIGAKRCKHLPTDQVLEFKRMVGQAIVNALQGAEKQSREVSAEAAKFLKERTVERSRIWTLTSAHVLLLVLSLTIAGLHKAAQACDLMQSDLLLALWLTTQGGLLGAYLSVIQKAGSGEWDAAAGLGLHVLEVFTKFFAGLIFGAIAFALTCSVHAPVSVQAMAADTYSIFLFGLAVGMFERLIPKMVSSYSQLATQKNPKE